MPSPDRLASHGRGGAGNIGKDKPGNETSPDDLVTPTLKGEHYTTGRGGSGNMARNDLSHPEVARASQDVEAPPPREPEGPHHIGRGGAANVAKDEHKAKGDEAAHAKAEDKGLLEKGKEFISKIGKK